MRFFKLSPIRRAHSCACQVSSCFSFLMSLKFMVALLTLPRYSKGHPFNLMPSRKIRKAAYQTSRPDFFLPFLASVFRCLQCWTLAWSPGPSECSAKNSTTRLYLPPCILPQSVLSNHQNDLCALLEGGNPRDSDSVAPAHRNLHLIWFPDDAVLLLEGPTLRTSVESIPQMTGAHWGGEVITQTHKNYR